MGSSSQTTLLLILSLICLYCCCCCSALQCGKQAGGKVCANRLCCSRYGYCGSTSAYCGNGCQSLCTRTGNNTRGRRSCSGKAVSSIITSSVFDQFFSHRNDGSCPSAGFYTYNAFLTAAAAFRGFGTAAHDAANKRELAAFFANTAHETTGGCYKEEIDQSDSYCSSSEQWPCAKGKKYFGRGPIQISWNYNYGPAGKAIGFDGINNPEVVATDPVISFKTAVWFWMTAECHSAIIRGKGFGQTISIINGGIECGGANTTTGQEEQQDRIALYKQFCGVLGVQPGRKLTC